MRLGYFTMPVHPINRNWAETLKEDREAVKSAFNQAEHPVQHPLAGEHRERHAEGPIGSDQCPRVGEPFLGVDEVVEPQGRHRREHGVGVEQAVAHDVETLGSTPPAQ